MKRYKAIGFLAIMVSLFIYVPAFAQGHGGGHGGHGGGNEHGGMHSGSHLEPDSLVQITVTGTVLVDSSTGMHPLYFLDTDGDGQANYHLNFGPYWYAPDSARTARPSAGETLTVTGGVHESDMFEMESIVVYEINGEYWRDPFTPFWNDMGRHSHQGGNSHGSEGCNFGMMDDSLETVSVSGSVLVDTTFVMYHYYLDEDGDGTPDYFLNFGPPWYQPESGAQLPENGQTIDVVAGLIEGPVYPMLIVYEINGLVWRDSTTIGDHFGGDWVQRDMGSAKRIHNPFDEGDWMQVNPGWARNWRGQMGMMMAPDSMFMQLLELYPENVPNSGQKNHFAGYQVGAFLEDGQACMGQGGNRGHMRFGSAAQFQLHYNDIQIKGFNLDENSITAQYWDDESNNWVTVENAVVDTENNTISFATTEIASYVILAADQVTGVQTETNGTVVRDFSIKQNYPNPFNPTTTIEFSLNNAGYVTLNVYNVLGEFVSSLVNGQMEAGVHKVTFSAGDLPSGTYFYELRIGQESKIMKMNLMK